MLSFLSFGYATGEFEVTAERLGVYRPEEHMYVHKVGIRQKMQRLRSDGLIVTILGIMQIMLMRADMILDYGRRCRRKNLLSIHIRG